MKRYNIRWRDIYRGEGVLELRDEEDILDVEQRTGNRAVAVTAEPMYLCGAEKADGEPCGRTVESRGETCFQHD